MKPCLLLLGLLATGCTRYLTHPTAYDRLVNLPTEPHKREVDILFSHDPPPNEPYIKVGVLEARGGEHTSYNELIREMQISAQELGVDAIQLLEKKYIADTEGTEVVDTYVTSTLAGLGLLYIKNATYLRRYVQAKDLYQYNDTTGRYDQLVCHAESAYDGTDPVVTGDPSWINLINRYDLNHLRYEETSDWWYTTDSYRQVAERGYSPNGSLIKKCKFTYNEQGQIARVLIRYPYRQQGTETIHLLYGEAGQILEKYIEREGQVPLREVPAYDEEGNLVGSEIFEARNGDQFDPYLRVVYRFFDPNNLPANSLVVTSTPKKGDLP